MPAKVTRFDMTPRGRVGVLDNSVFIEKTTVPGVYILSVRTDGGIGAEVKMRITRTQLAMLDDQILNLLPQ